MDHHIGAELSHWIIFTIIVMGFLIADLWHSSRHPHGIELKEAILTSVGWISLAFLFNFWIYKEFGQEAALLFLAGYLLEKSLSVDNLFVFLLIFSHFRPPANTKHSILFYGILGAILMRAILIWGGIVLVQMFSWVFYIFGIFLIYTGVKLGVKKEEEHVKIEENFVYKFLSSKIPFTHVYHERAFVIKENGKWKGTPLLIILVLVELTDLVFALDSVPAILGITTDPFLVYTSNIFAILGLRSLFFVLEDSMQRFYLLHYALSVILIFIGCKMLLANWVHIPIGVTLGILVTLLGTALIGSFLFPKKLTK